MIDLSKCQICQLKFFEKSGGIFLEINCVDYLEIDFMIEYLLSWKKIAFVTKKKATKSTKNLFYEEKIFSIFKKF